MPESRENSGNTELSALHAFDENAGGAFRTASQLADFGSKQNAVNEQLSEKIDTLRSRIGELEETLRIKDDELSILRGRLSQLEERERQTAELMKKLAQELSGHKKEVDRVRLAEKLNSGAIERLDGYFRYLSGGRKKNGG
ncbi:MAG: hypothetical protein IJ874_05550 [Ruminococcus sp.]|nr:hypothetical protein [Ruminococcus sp.]